MKKESQGILESSDSDLLTLISQLSTEEARDTAYIKAVINGLTDKPEFVELTFSYLDAKKEFSTAANIAERLGQTEKAFDYYEQAGYCSTPAQQSEVYTSAAELAIKIGDNKKAFDYYERGRNYAAAAGLAYSMQDLVSANYYLSKVQEPEAIKSLSGMLGNVELNALSSAQLFMTRVREAKLADNALFFLWSEMKEALDPMQMLDCIYRICETEGRYSFAAELSLYNMETKPTNWHKWAYYATLAIELED